MNLLKLIGSIFKPAMEGLDALNTTEHEKLQQKAAMLETYVTAIDSGIRYEQEALKAKAKIIETEAASGHWITSTWRPITMLCLLGLVILDSFGWLANPLSSEAWTLLQIGIGGYVVGRSVEKTATPIIKALKGRDET